MTNLVRLYLLLLLEYAYNQDEEEDNYDPYGGHNHQSGGQRCQYQ